MKEVMRLMEIEQEEEEEANTHYACPDFSFLSDNDFLREEFLFSKYQLLDETRFNVASPPLEKCLEEIIAKLGDEESVPKALIPNNEVANQAKNESPISLISLRLLNTHGSGPRRLNLEPRDEPTRHEAEGKRLSANEVLRIAGEKFIQSAFLSVGEVSCALSHPLESEESRDIVLVELLLACAEKVGYGQFERARKLLCQCYQSCSKTGSSVERVVYYFCEALREKINRETKDEKPEIKESACNTMTRMNPTIHAFHEAVPFSQLCVFAGIQAIVERVENAKRVHIIDLGIRSGMQWTILMQALSSSSSSSSSSFSCGSSHLELLKITALGTSQKDMIEETGERLSSFAQTLGIPFSFKVVMVSDMSRLSEELFELDSDETVAVYSSFVLRFMLVEPGQLESLMRVIKGLNPCVMVVAEVEANHNSPAFVSRFVEALFFFGAYFDCLETFMKGDYENRLVTESDYFGDSIVNMVATEGAERKSRSVTVDVWRAFFARFGLVDSDLSSSSSYQVKLIQNKFSCEDSCTVHTNGKCLIFRWKGTPIQSLSVWKFLEH